ncbi:hypothetical protein PRIEUP_LOCUS553, partial [Pristimantis euphronides]
MIFSFAINKINQNPNILPNITLGYQIYDSCLDERLAVKSVLHLLCGPNKEIPNYCCEEGGPLAGVIGDYHSSTTVPAAQILGIYGYTQISYGATDYSLTDRLLYPHVFRTVQNHHVHNMVIAKLLQHFGWTWVGILVSNDDIGENELQVLTEYMREYGICAAFTIKVTEEISTTCGKISDIIKNLGVNIILLCGTYTNQMTYFLMGCDINIYYKTFIIPPSWASCSVITENHIPYFNGSLTVQLSSPPIPGTEEFVKNYKNLSIIDFLRSFWPKLDLLSGDSHQRPFISFTHRNKKNNFTYKYVFPSMRNLVSSGVSPRLYYAVEVMAQILHDMFLFFKVKLEATRISNSVPLLHHQLHHYLKRMKQSYDSGTSGPYFDENGETVHPYKITNWLYKDEATVLNVHVGNFTPWAVDGQQLHMDDQAITWKKTGEVPVSRCSERCSPGSRKKPGENVHTCCYDCVPCPEGEISNIT